LSGLRERAVWLPRRRCCASVRATGACGLVAPEAMLRICPGYGSVQSGCPGGDAAHLSGLRERAVWLPRRRCCASVRATGSCGLVAPEAMLRICPGYGSVRSGFPGGDAAHLVRTTGACGLVAPEAMLRICPGYGIVRSGYPGGDAAHLSGLQDRAVCSPDRRISAASGRFCGAIFRH
ncbi:hypothetical protein QFI96_013770, partial [Raoultella sp. TW_WC1a-1]